MRVTPNDLRKTNQRLRSFLEELSVTEMASETIGCKMEGIFTELLRVGGRLPNAEAVPVDRELREEMDQYRENLDHLQALLPKVHVKLLTERARLESERAHLEAANAWVRASRHIES